MSATNYGASIVVPFALSTRWIVTVQSERHFVKVRHRTRWYAVARRIGHEDRRHWCTSRTDACAIAEMMREGFKELEEAERIQALYYSLPAWKRAQIDVYLETNRGQE